MNKKALFSFIILKSFNLVSMEPDSFSVEFLDHLSAKIPVQTVFTTPRKRSLLEKIFFDAKNKNPIIGQEYGNKIQKIGKWAQTASGISSEKQSPIYKALHVPFGIGEITYVDKIAVPIHLSRAHLSILKGILLHEAYHLKAQHSLHSVLLDTTEKLAFGTAMLSLSSCGILLTALHNRYITNSPIGIYIALADIPISAISAITLLAIKGIDAPRRFGYERNADLNVIKHMGCATCMRTYSQLFPKKGTDPEREALGYLPQESFTQKAKELSEKGTFCEYHQSLFRIGENIFTTMSTYE